MAEEMTAFDFLLFRAEEDPKSRSLMTAGLVLDRVPEWDRLVRTWERASRVVPRLRQKVVVPPLPVANGVWVIDADFDLSYHLRRVVLPPPGTVDQFFDFAHAQNMIPLDRARPLWEVFIVEGLPDGKAGLVTKMHHAITDGIGGYELARQIWSDDADAPEPPMPPAPMPEDLTPQDLLRKGIMKLPVSGIGGAIGLAQGAARTAVQAIRRPVGTVSDVGAYLQSLGRVMRPPPTPPSPALRRRSLSRGYALLEIPLADLKRAAKAADGSVNDAYLAGLAGALRLYHERVGMPVDELPMAIPISLRSEDDPAGGNRWAGARFPCPVGIVDPRERIQRLRELVLVGRAEPALGSLDVLAPVLARVPSFFLAGLAGQPVDMQASNIPGMPKPFYVAGAQVEKMTGFGPLPGAAIMAVMTSYSGTCYLTVNFDAASVTDQAAFRECLRAGMDEVLELGRPQARPRRRTAPAEPTTEALFEAGAERPTIDAEKIQPEKEAEERGRRAACGDGLEVAFAEIAAAPTGPGVGAFFDFDGTLIFGYSGQVFAADRLRRREVGVGELARSIKVGVEFGMGRAGFTDLLESGGAWRGRGDDELAELGERLFSQKISDRMYPEARDLVIAHQRRGHTVVLTSSATRYQVEPMARSLGIEHVLCTRMEAEDGILTGRVEQSLWGEGKAEEVQKFAANHGIDLHLSYFYADGNEDIALMHLVGKARPVNPGKQLAKVAQRRGWPILRFTSRGRPSVGMLLRSAVSMASLAPMAVGSLVVWVLSRDKREALNFLFKWGELSLAINGIKVDVVGEQNLWSHRPAVFIFNHRNNIDPLIVGSLIERDLTGIGKKELARDPIMGTIGRLMDAVFIDRSDTASAVAALQPVTKLAEKGLSIMVSPEGTRSRAFPVGPFKKGPFRIAMAAHIHVVPVVIRNADSIASRSGSFIRPGTVDVAVLPPISVEDWTLEDLGERIDGVRKQFVDTLNHWPSIIRS